MILRKESSNMIFIFTYIMLMALPLFITKQDMSTSENMYMIVLSFIFLLFPFQILMNSWRCYSNYLEKNHYEFYKTYPLNIDVVVVKQILTSALSITIFWAVGLYIYYMIYNLTTTSLDNAVMLSNYVEMCFALYIYSFALTTIGTYLYSVFNGNIIIVLFFPIILCIHNLTLSQNHFVIAFLDSADIKYLFLNTLRFITITGVSISGLLLANKIRLRKIYS